MTKLALLATLPDLVREIESALLQIGRGDIVDQLREASIERWSYDDFAHTTSLYVRPPESSSVAAPRARAETVSIHDELGIILETDDRGRVAVIEISGGKDIVGRLEAVRRAQEESKG